MTRFNNVPINTWVTRDVLEAGIMGMVVTTMGAISAIGIALFVRVWCDIIGHFCVTSFLVEKQQGFKAWKGEL